jgi:RNA polymerase sigma-70 factor (ECF subfamily)
MSAVNLDIKIIDSVLNGNIDNFVVLVNRHRERVFLMTAKRVPGNDIEDVTQEVFIRAFKNLHTFSRQKPFANWLCIIVLRTCSDYWRKNYKRRELIATAYCNGTGNSDNIEWLGIIVNEKVCANYPKNVRQKELRELLDWTLNKLSPEDRRLIEVVYFEGLSFKEAAEKLDWRLSKTRVRAMRARHKMKKLLNPFF